MEEFYQIKLFVYVLLDTQGVIVEMVNCLILNKNLLLNFIIFLFKGSLLIAIILVSIVSLILIIIIIVLILTGKFNKCFRSAKNPKKIKK